jgi:hypothetical protein
MMSVVTPSRPVIGRRDSGATWPELALTFIESRHKVCRNPRVPGIRAKAIPSSSLNPHKTSSIPIRIRTNRSILSGGLKTRSVR